MCALQVYTPLLTSDSLLVEGWPPETREALSRACSALHCGMVMARGEVRGETHLPLPPMEDYLTVQQVPGRVMDPQ